ncbi:MAG: hypothetical protein ACE10B_09500 [Phycisphaerales bacterium]|nr:hypothetical protein [Planctomycetota bacterium]
MRVGLSLSSTGDPRHANLLSEIFPWLVALLVLVCLGAVAIYALRRSLHRRGPQSADGFTLQQLRDLHAAGQLTDHEFERAKAAIIGRFAGPNTGEEQIEPDQRDADSAE